MEKLDTPNTLTPEKNPSSPPPQEKKKPGFISDTLRFTVIALLIVIPFRIFIAQPFLVNGASMDPTFDDGNYLIVDQLTYQFREPERGSVIIFKYPVDPSKYFIKRVIGLPGDTVEIKNGDVSIKNQDHPEGFALNETYITFAKVDNLTATVKAGEYFVLGDNRAGSLDSRYWGGLPKKDVIGRPILRLFPIQRIGVWPGDAADIIH